MMACCGVMHGIRPRQGCEGKGHLFMYFMFCVLIKMFSKAIWGAQLGLGFKISEVDGITFDLTSSSNNYIS